MVFAPGCTQQPVMENDAGHAVETPAQKRDANPVRHDLEPLTKRFPNLGSPVSASWVSGNMGDSRVPGPSLYWIDAVVELAPDTASQLAEKFAPQATSTGPDVWQSLAGDVPQGEFLASEALNMAFTSQDVKAKAFLSQNTPVLVLTAMGE
jgi:hypothetical protein